MGGTWASIIDGSKESLVLLEQIVTFWGQMPERKRKSQDGV
jgi:hypothetical protein